MYHDPLNNAAFILYLIREGAATWEALCEHLKMDPRAQHTGTMLLEKALDTLAQAKLIEVKPPIEEFRRGAFAKATFSVTPLLHHVQTALDISLASLAHSDPRNRIIVSPLFYADELKEYGRDIFVLMPFDAKLAAVYEDHLKVVASNLGMTIGRADDFFTEHEIMTEIWSAIAASKVLIADCTGRNPNVFYEVGLAHALGKPVILVAQQAQDIPFDLRHRRYIIYELTPRGMKAFEQSLGKTLEGIKVRDTK